MMSFMGSIGTLMDGSGIASALQTIYGENSVKHILGGKAIARAVRGHLLVGSAIQFMLLQILFSLDEPVDCVKMTEEELQIICDNINSAEDISKLNVMKKPDDCLSELKTSSDELFLYYFLYFIKYLGLSVERFG